MTDCVFCSIVAGDAPATFVATWTDAVAIRPLGPVVDGHVLVLPKLHVRDAGQDPYITAVTMERAASLAKATMPGDYNIITSAGAAATQSVFHLHLHLVPRAENDGLALPWYSGKRSKRERVTTGSQS